jgi:hypothetical protein
MISLKYESGFEIAALCGKTILNMFLDMGGGVIYGWVGLHGVGNPLFNLLTVQDAAF